MQTKHCTAFTPHPTDSKGLRLCPNRVEDGGRFCPEHREPVLAAILVSKGEEKLNA